jgi:ATP-dependent DNA helicase RecQ
MGEKRLADLGTELAALIAAYCPQHGLSTNQGSAAVAKPPIAKLAQPKSQSVARDAAFLMFQQGRTVQEVATFTDRALSTTWQYLGEFITERGPKSIDAWVAPAVYRRVADAAADAETPRLKPLFEQLNGEVAYEEIRLVLAYLRMRAEQDS